MSRDPAMPRFRSLSGASGSARARAAANGDEAPAPRAAGEAGAKRRGGGDHADTPPVPPRSRLRRAAGAMFTPMLVIVGVFGGHLAWTTYAEWRLGQYVERLRQAGEPIHLREIEAPAVPDEENAALEFCIAGRELNATDLSWRAYFRQGPPRLPMTEQQLEVVRAVLAVNRQALEHVTLASGKPKLDWSPIVSAEWTEEKPYYVLRGQGVYRLDTLANLLFAAALVAHAEGDEAAALARIDELLFLARSISSRRTMSAYSYSLAREESALAAIGQILPDLSIGNGPGQAPASRVSALVERLLDEGPYVEAMRRNVRAERARQIESFMPPAGGGSREFGAADPWGALPSSGHLWRSWKFQVLKPVRLTAEYQALMDLELSIAALQPNRGVHMLSAFVEHPMTGGTGHDGAFVRSVSASVYAIAHNHSRALARRRATAVGLACRLYHVEHGAWPAPGLGALVPRYLAEIPADPLHRGGEPLVYVPGPVRPRIYSVGADGIDDGGNGYSALATDVPGPRPADVIIDLERQPLPPIVHVSMLLEDEEPEEEADAEAEGQ